MQPVLLKSLIRSKKYSKWLNEELVYYLVELRAKIADYVIQIHPELTPEDYELPKLRMRH